MIKMFIVLGNAKHPAMVHTVLFMLLYYLLLIIHFILLYLLIFIFLDYFFVFNVYFVCWYCSSGVFLV